MFVRSAALLMLLTMALTGAAQAQDTGVPDPGHPRVNEVDQRLQDQQNRTDTGISNGQIASPQRAGADAARDTRISNAARRDEAAHNGHLTKRNQRQLNRRLNRNSKHIHQQRHNQ